MTEREKNASDKAQKLISRFISECEDEDSAKKAGLILIDELFKWGLPSPIK